MIKHFRTVVSDNINTMKMTFHLSFNQREPFLIESFFWLHMFKCINADLNKN